MLNKELCSVLPIREHGGKIMIIPRDIYCVASMRQQFIAYWKHQLNTIQTLQRLVLYILHSQALLYKSALWSVQWSISLMF
jgi:hypothetical protein